jgi:hypothetical protein
VFLSYLNLNGYIDAATRSVFVDSSFYNEAFGLYTIVRCVEGLRFEVQLKSDVIVRLSFECFETGGVSSAAQVATYRWVMTMMMIMVMVMVMMMVMMMVMVMVMVMMMVMVMVMLMVLMKRICTHSMCWSWHHLHHCHCAIVTIFITTTIAVAITIAIQ